MKLSIMGYSGSGKSTLAKGLGEHFQIPVFHLDKVHFTEGWKQKPYAQALEEVREILSLDDWIIDGNYGNYALQKRLLDSDVIIYLAMNRFRCFHRCYKRYLRYRGQTREDLAPGCPEKFDKEFAWWILYKGRNAQKKRTMKSNLASHKKKLIYLSTPKQVESLLKYVKERKEVL